MTRPDGRQPDELRPISFERDFTTMAGGSVLVAFGGTRVLCTASVDDDVPRWMKGQGQGWVTAEYSMLPGSSAERVDREAVRGKQGGRTMEIQRLIGRALRAACDLVVLGERQVVVDCDVLQADGGTRTASICGGYLALHDALARLVQSGQLGQHPLHSLCAAISVGIVDATPVLDLPYVEDSRAEVDMNVVMLAGLDGQESRFVEVQGTAEGTAFTRSELDELAGAGRARPRRAVRPASASTCLCRPVAGRGADRGREAPARLLVGQPGQGGRDRGDSRRRRRSAAEAARGGRGGGGRRHAGGQRPPQGPRRWCRRPGFAAVADDTGLFVDALGGAPGVWSARYAGERATYADNRAKLLAALAGVPAGPRTRRTVPHRCARALARRP